MIKNQFCVTIKRFQSNNAKDYFNQVLTPYFQHEVIIHESSCVNNPQQNGVTERKNDHLLNTTRAFLFQKHVPKTYQGGVILTTTHLINRLPSKVLSFKSPMDILSLFYPNIRTTNHLIPKIFGYVSFVHVHNPNKGKLDPKAIKQSNVFLQDIPQLKRGTSVTIHLSKGFLSQQMSLSTRVSPIFLFLIFRGEIPSRKTRIGIPISSISFSLTLLQSLVQCLIKYPYSYRNSLNLQYPYPTSLNLSHGHLSLLLRIE